MKRLLGIALLLLCIMMCGCDNEGTTQATEGEQASNIHIIEESGPSKSDSSTDKKNSATDNADNSKDGEDKLNNANVQQEMSAWITYWDGEPAYQKLLECEDDIDKLCLFAAYFNINEELFIPAGTDDVYNRLKEEGRFEKFDTYLTIVNDMELNQGSSLKDTKLLYDLFDSEEKADKHSDDIIAMAKRLGVDGIEIDYEAIKRDEKLWELFVSFLNKLSDKCDSEGLALRILLEPSAPTGDYEWPANAEYVMMCYNLYGYGTKPGPKADDSFLTDMVDKMRVLPGTQNFALSNGGFDFDSDGRVAQISTASAEQLATDNGAAVQMDTASHAYYYDYADAEGKKHQVWFTRKDTIEHWSEVIKEQGYGNISLWKLGG